MLVFVCTSFIDRMFGKLRVLLKHHLGRNLVLPSDQHPAVLGFQSQCFPMFRRADRS